MSNSFTAEVIDVDLSFKSPNYLYGITFKFLDVISNSNEGIHTARPLHTFIKHIPVPGEIVNIVESANSYSNNGRNGSGWYYTPSVGIYSSIHYNGLDGSSNISIQQNTNYNVALTGNHLKQVNQISRNKKSFILNKNVFPIQPYIGDTIIESRYGSSIRMSSTVNGVDNPPFWQSPSNTNNPIVIIRNTKRNDIGNTKFIKESLSDDDSLIIMSSGLSIPIKLSTNSISTSVRNKIYSLTSNIYANQIILSSDRIILNSKNNEILLASKGGISLNTNAPIVLQSSQKINLSSYNIELTPIPTDSAVLGTQLIQVLTQMISLINPALTAPGILSPILPQLQLILSKHVRLS